MTQAAIDAIKARLESTPAPWPVLVFDGPPDDGAATPYICIWDQTGQKVREKYTGQAGRTYWPLQLSCVARGRDGLRTLTSVARTVLDWAPISGATPLVEDGTNPVLTESVGGDERLTAPLTMHCYLPKEM